MRILLSGMSNMLASLITGALGQFPPMIIVGHAQEGDDLISEIRSTHADAVIMQSHDPSHADDFEPLLRVVPVLKVVAITSDGSSGFVHELRPYSLPLPELSAEPLLTALRDGPTGRPH